MTKTESANHELKTDPFVFAAVLSGAKTHEIRKNDRSFAVGDELLLRETVHTGEHMRLGAPLEYTGRTIKRTVSHVLTGYGLLPDWCILSFSATTQASTAQSDEILSLHRRLAAETLRASQGWERAEAKSKECIELRDRMAASTAQAEPLELAAQLRNAHRMEIWDWDYLLNAASMLEKLAAKSSTDAQATAAVRDDTNFYDEVTVALGLLKQDYSSECLQMASVEEYVEDAVSQLISAGYRRALRAGDTGEQADGGAA